ncbi:hypothetical protein ACJMK2_001934 [Sinanodonta woodiana]|uniref:Uncharacterized protein n=1 Tax=Sinanodonta woodiana TaxID=1069815 RepID=A0ABD3XX90_SINWO
MDGPTRVLVVLVCSFVFLTGRETKASFSCKYDYKCTSFGLCNYKTRTCDNTCCNDRTNDYDTICCTSSSNDAGTAGGATGGVIGSIVAFIVIYWWCCRPSAKVVSTNVTTVVY